MRAGSRRIGYGGVRDFQKGRLRLPHMFQWVMPWQQLQRALYGEGPGFQRRLAGNASCLVRERAAVAFLSRYIWRLQDKNDVALTDEQGSGGELFGFKRR